MLLKFQLSEFRIQDFIVEIVDEGFSIIYIKFFSVDGIYIV